MKRILVCMFSALLVMLLSGCKKEKDFGPELTDFLRKWAISIREWNYADYSSYVKYIKSETQFHEKYQYYYPQDPVILKLEKLHDDGNKLKFRLHVSFYGIDRTEKVKNSDINSILVIEKEGSKYKIDEQIFINNKYD